MSNHLIKRTFRRKIIFRFKLRKWVSKSIKLKRIIYSPSKTRTLSFFKHLHSLLLNIKVASPLGHEQKQRSPSSLLTSALNLAQFMESLLSWSHNDEGILKKSVPCCQPWSPSDLTLKISRSSDMVIAVKYIFMIKINSILNIFAWCVSLSGEIWSGHLKNPESPVLWNETSFCHHVSVIPTPENAIQLLLLFLFYKNYLCQSWWF